MNNSTQKEFVYEVIFDEKDYKNDKHFMELLIPQYREFFRSHNFEDLSFRVIERGE